MNTRRVLDQRRFSENLLIRFNNQDWIMTIGFYPNGDPGEVFINALKNPGSDLDAQASDGAILMSLCLQYGVPLETMAHAVKRDDRGQPMAITGIMLERLINWRRK